MLKNNIIFFLIKIKKYILRYSLLYSFVIVVTLSQTPIFNKKYCCYSITNTNFLLFILYKKYKSDGNLVNKKVGVCDRVTTIYIKIID